MAALEDESTGDTDLEIASRDFKKLESTHVKTGLREGVAAGKEKALQCGFCVGYSNGVQCGLHWAILKGKVSAVQSCCSLPEAKTELTALMAEVTSQAKLHITATAESQRQTFSQSLPEDGSAAVALVKPELKEHITLEGLIAATHIPPAIADLERKLDEILTKFELK